MKLKYIMSILIPAAGMLAMEKPAVKSGDQTAQPVPKSASAKNLQADQLTYFRHLSNAETQAHQMVDEAQNYHEAVRKIKQQIEQNPILSPKDKNELFDGIKARLDEKFFPEVHSRHQKRLPAVKK